MRRPALWVAIVFASGIAISYYVRIPVLFWWVGAATSLVVGGMGLLLERSRRPSWQVVFALVVFLSGGFRHEAVTRHLPGNHIARFPDFGEAVRLRGSVADEPTEVSTRGRITLEAEEVVWNGNRAEVCGRVLVTCKEGIGGIDFGDLVAVEGRLRRPEPARNPGAFDYRKYLERRGIFAQLAVRKKEQIETLEKGETRSFFSGVVLPTRRSIRSTVDRNLLGVPAALLKGLLLGEKRTLPQDVREAFGRVGVSHVLAVSGLHVGVIAAVFFFVFQLLGFSSRGATAATIAALLVYAFVVDLQPSVVRAALMAGLILIGFAAERNADIGNVLGAAALAILLLWPQRLFDVGFQLSFAAVGSIVLLYTPIIGVIHPIFGKPTNPVMRGIVAAIAVSTAAQIGTGPVVAFYFNRIALLSVAANLFVVPAMGIIVTLGLLAAAFGFWFVPFATAFNAANWAFLSALIAVVQVMSKIPHTVFITPSPGPIFFAGYYGLIALILWGRKSQIARKTLLFLALFATNVYIWQGILRQDRLEVVFLDVGQGDAIFLRFPNGRIMLVDGGGRMFQFDTGKEIIAPFLRHRGFQKIDVVVPTHSDNDHIGGLLSLLEEFPVSHVLDSGQYADTWTDDRFYELVEQKGITRHIVSAGDSLIGLGGVGIFVLHPAPAFVSSQHDSPMGRNNTSVVLKISYRGVSFLLTGDAEQGAERFFLNWGDRLPATVLKVGHHGSRGSTGQAFLDAVRPEIAILSVGAGNRYGHPSEDVVSKLQAVDAKIFRTDQTGAVLMEVGEDSVKVETMRP
ncbi:MAG: DNA internalization-related competence protein ComEC/Rec2 [Candidatus Latescibacterota bacterium]